MGSLHKPERSSIVRLVRLLRAAGIKPTSRDALPPAAARDTYPVAEGRAGPAAGKDTTRVGELGFESQQRREGSTRKKQLCFLWK
uniref:Uncharacterized protein n=1 Tax=Aegilops tauschii TaxID=37682 RepID=M8AQ18_AEGTA